MAGRCVVKTIVATFITITEFDAVPDTSELEDIVESLRGIGDVKSAKLKFLKEVEKEMA